MYINICAEKVKTVSAITMTLSALYRLPADSAPFSVWQHNKYMFTDHVDISQAFVQGELLPGDGDNCKVYISPPPGHDEDPLYMYHLFKPLYSMPSAARAWHTTMSAFLAKEGCAMVGFECGPSRLTVLVSF